MLFIIIFLFAVLLLHDHGAKFDIGKEKLTETYADRWIKCARNKLAYLEITQSSNHQIEYQHETSCYRKTK